jgi:hypothetical protein
VERDSFRAVTPDGRVLVEALFTSADGETITFHCRVVLDGDFTSPMEEMLTQDEGECLRWMRKQMTEAMRRNG